MGAMNKGAFPSTKTNLFLDFISFVKTIISKKNQKLLMVRNL